MPVVQLNTVDLNKITEIMKKFPEVERFKIIEERHSGIGNTIELVLDYKVNGIESTVTIEISGVENW